MQNSRKFYNTDLFIWLMLIFFAPLGLYLLWRRNRYSTVSRAVLSIVFGLVFLFQAILLNNRLGTNNNRYGTEFAKLGTDSKINYGQSKKNQNVEQKNNKKPGKNKDKYTPAPTLQTTIVPESPTPQATASPITPMPSAVEPTPSLTASAAPTAATPTAAATPVETVIPQEPTPTEVTPAPTMPEPSSNTTPIVQPPAPTATQDTTSNNEINAVNTGTTIDENGVQTTVYKVDESLLRQKLAAVDAGTLFKVLVPNNSSAISLMLSGEIIKELEQKNVTLAVNAANVNYEFPAKAINIGNISANTGSNISLADINIRVSISGVTQSTISVLNDNATLGKFELEASPINTSITANYGNTKVELKQFNSYISRTVSVPNDVGLNKITTAVALNSDGTIRHIPTNISVIEGKYYAKINSMTNSVYTLIWNPKEFNDMGAHWAKAQVNEMYSRKIISGITDGIFEPDRSITRAEFATIVVKALGLEPVGSNSFTDVKTSDWFYNYVGTASRHGIILGVGGGEFQPARSISREEAMAMVQRAAKLAGMNVEVSDNEIANTLARFTDYADFSDWAKGIAAFNIRENLIKGSNGLARPKDNITRAETVVVIMRMLQRSDLIDSRIIA